MSVSVRWLYECRLARIFRTLTRRSLPGVHSYNLTGSVRVLGEWSHHTPRIAMVRP